ncbi:RhaT Permeases of the drug/metabolite transporter (DMT) superfamily [Candidatus Planktophila versatilis]|uniref:DMT family transporter n=1 Tax=Candidatus Planktophila versatilis TaxID=1884905 RepID=UPI003BEF3BEA
MNTPVQRQSSWIPAYITLGIVWGCSFIFIKLGLEILTPFGVAFVRCALGALALLIYAKLRGISLPKDRMVRFHLWVVAIFINVIPGIFFALAETAVTSILAGIINAVTPLMTIIAILVINREEKPKPSQLLGLLLGFLGVLTVLGAWRGLGDNPLWAILALLLAVSCYGISFPYTRKYVIPLKIQTESLMAMQLTLAAFTLLPFFLFDGISKYEYRIGPVLAMIGLGVFGSGFAYLWNYKVIQQAGSAIASSVTYLTPLVAIIVGIIFLNESITWNEPVGALIVLFGAAIAQERITLKQS